MKNSATERGTLKVLTANFARVHKMLLELQMTELEKAQAIEIKPATRLGLLLNDPKFAWLRHLSQLMAIADDVYFQKEEISGDQMDRIKKATLDLFINNSQPDFTKAYESSAAKLTALQVERSQLQKILAEF